MTTLGKIFTGLIAMMSIVFMAFATMIYSNDRDIRAQVNQMQAKLNAATTANQELTTENENLRNSLSSERAARQSAIAALESRSQRLVTRMRENQDRNDELVRRQRDALIAMNTAQTNFTNQADEVRRLRDLIRDIQEDRDDKFSQAIQLTDSVNLLRNAERGLLERQGQLITQVAHMRTLLESNGLDENMSVDNIPPDVDGEILDVGAKRVEISLGSDDGLRKGHTLDVSRGSTYLGRIVVTNTFPDVAVAEVLKLYRTGRIRRGDRVDTKID